MRRRKSIMVVFCRWKSTLIVVLATAAAMPAGKFRLGFGSCLNQYRRSLTLEAVRRESFLSAWIFAGDSGYHDVPGCGVPWNSQCSLGEWYVELRRWILALWRLLVHGSAKEDEMRRRDDYEALGRIHVDPLREALHSDVPILATWDDHDFGKNDAGSEYRFAKESKKAFLEFWTKDDREVVYSSFRSEEDVLIILLDCRSHRTPLKNKGGLLHKAKSLARAAVSASDDCPLEDSYEIDYDGTMLGEEQWSWFEEQMKMPASLYVIVSSTQVLREYDGTETWGVFPRERARLLSLLSTRKSLILSGDVHYGELSRIDDLYEFTSSGLSESWPCAHRNPYRVFPVVRPNNFGVVTVVEKNDTDVLLSLQLKDQNGTPLLDANVAVH